MKLFKLTICFQILLLFSVFSSENRASTNFYTKNNTHLIDFIKMQEDTVFVSITDNDDSTTGGFCSIYASNEEVYVSNDYNMFKLKDGNWISVGYFGDDVLPLGWAQMTLQNGKPFIAGSHNDNIVTVWTIK